MRNILRATGLAVIVGAGLAACYPERTNQPNNYASITTIHDTLMAFNSVTTFYVPDSVVHLGPSGGSDNISHAFDSLIIARTAANMTSRGYTRVDDPLAADLTLNPAVTLVDNYDFTGLDWCVTWGWAYPWTCTGWIPGYPTDIIGFEYSAATVLIPMADLSGGVPPIIARPPAVWLAGLNGVVSGNSASIIADQIANGINQAFAQSPYIFRTNP